MFQSESTLYRCLNVKELLARNRRGVCSLSDCKRTGTPNHLVRKRTLNYLAKLASLRTNWLWVWVLLQANIHWAEKHEHLKLTHFFLRWKKMTKLVFIVNDNKPWKCTFTCFTNFKKVSTYCKFPLPVVLLSSTDAWQCISIENITSLCSSMMTSLPTTDNFTGSTKYNM